MSRKKSIGVVALIEFIDEGTKAVLQVREQSDSFPGCSQLTFHGRVEEGEDLKTALRREAREELKELFDRASLPVPQVFENMIEVPPKSLHVAGRASTPIEQIASLSFTIRDPNVTTLIQPLVEAGIINLVSQDDLSQIVTINPKTKIHKKKGVGKGLIGMFADERLVLERVLSDQN